MERLKTELCGITLDNPVIPASGTFGYGYEFAELYDINILGTFSFKGYDCRTTFRKPRAENCGNSVGNAQCGRIAESRRRKKSFPKNCRNSESVFRKKVIANVGGFSVDEYVRVSEKLDAEESVGWLEINVSCPNVHSGGTNFGSDPKAAAEVVAAVKRQSKNLSYQNFRRM